MRKLYIIRFLFILILTLYSTSYGYTILTQKGKSGKIGVYYWNKSNIPVHYVIDSGDFGIENIDPVSFVQSGFNTWQNVSTSYISFSMDGQTESDINVETIKANKYLIVDSICEIVFDNDGSIIEDVFGLDKDTLLGVGVPVVYGGDSIEETEEHPYTGEIFDGFVLINTSADVPIESYKSTFIHEIGHFIGLGHTTLGVQLIEDTNNNGRLDEEDDFKNVPTMFPFALPDDSVGITLEPDDIAAVSVLYPKEEIKKNFGTISGKILRSEGDGVFGASVIALRYEGLNKFYEGVGILSGYYSGPGGDGEFNIFGIPPGNYLLLVQPVTDNETAMTGENIGLLFEDVETNFACEFYSDINCHTGRGGTIKEIDVPAGKRIGNVEIIVGQEDKSIELSSSDNIMPILPYILEDTPNDILPEENSESNCGCYYSSSNLYSNFYLIIIILISLYLLLKLKGKIV